MLFILLSSVLVFAQAKADDDILRMDITDLRPTQMHVGMLEVKRKAEKLSSMTRSERNEYLRANPIPVVVGPKNRLYLIDHHHMAHAILDSGFHKAYVKIVADLSELPKEEFWREMSDRGYLYLKDEFGKDINSTQLPKSVPEMLDDPYRSLAGRIRKLGGFAKDMTPFAEFKWATFFRERIPLAFVKAKFFQEKAIPLAMSLVSGSDARALPGYRFQCKHLLQR